MDGKASITEVPGFRAAGVHAGLKKDGMLDVALVVCDRPCIAGATFTRNLVRAAPVLFDEAALANGAEKIQAVIVNSKNANAVTGEQGLRDAEEMARRTEEALKLPGGSVLVMSTGVIGVPLPMKKISEGIRLAASSLGDAVEDGKRAAEAIMTTDTYPKAAVRRCTLGERTVTLAGLAKGSGMIHPDMGTMLGLIVTDAAIARGPLQASLRYAVDRSYNCISVDGDTSTNDTQLVLASGAAGNPLIDREDHPDFPTFQETLYDICADLARQIAFDGEGATKRVTIQVRGTDTFEEARQIGRTIATSPLVKTALFGNDANWGRVLAAAGRAGVPFDLATASLWFGDLQLLLNGKPIPVDEARALEVLSREDIYLALSLDQGEAAACVWSCDLSYDYIKINAEYRT